MSANQCPQCGHPKMDRSRAALDQCPKCDYARLTPQKHTRAGKSVRASVLDNSIGAALENLNLGGLR